MTDGRPVCFRLDEIADIVTDLMHVAEDLRTHSTEDVNARLIDLVADQLLRRAFGTEQESHGGPLEAGSLSEPQTLRQRARSPSSPSEGLKTVQARRFVQA